MSDFEEFRKIARLNRDVVITEKIDGTNAQVFIEDDGVTMHIGSRSRWITPDNDNHGFARWALANQDNLLKLGPGRHYGEWWGQGIQRTYGLKEKRFWLFNTSRWNAENLPAGVGVVPELYRGPFDTHVVNNHVKLLWAMGSVAAPGFMKPEGVVVYHSHSNTLYKVTCEKDELHKSQVTNG